MTCDVISYDVINRLRTLSKFVLCRVFIPVSVDKRVVKIVKIYQETWKL